MPLNWYRKGFRAGLQDSEYDPPNEEAAAYEYELGYLDATSGKKLEVAAHDHERAEIARKQKAGHREMYHKDIGEVR